jgi:hypothetical protein
MHDTLTSAERAPRLARLRGFAARLRDCTSGLALTEFAFALPVLLTLGLFGLETANLAMAHLRVSQIAVLTADNAARYRDSIDETDVIELFTGAKMTGNSINFRQNGRIILSSLENNAGTQWLRWQRCDGALNIAPSYGRPRTAAAADILNATEIYNTDRQTPSSNPSSPAQSNIPATGMGPTTQRISAQSGTAVMMVEVTYNYQPIIPNTFLSNMQIRYESGFNVRQRTNQSISNLTRTTPRMCNAFNA